MPPGERAKAGGASERAVHAAYRRWTTGGAASDYGNAVKALAAAHDPALGEDRSVRLGDVLDALRNHPDAGFRGLYAEAAYWLAAEFQEARGIGGESA